MQQLRGIHCRINAFKLLSRFATRRELLPVHHFSHIMDTTLIWQGMIGGDNSAHAQYEHPLQPLRKLERINTERLLTLQCLGTGRLLLPPTTLAAHPQGLPITSVNVI